MSFVIIDPKTPISDLITKGKTQYLALIRLYASLPITAEALYRATVQVGLMFAHFRSAADDDNPDALVQAVSELMNFKLPEGISNHINAQHASALAVDKEHI